MDEYKQHVYDRNPDHWNAVEVGDLSYMKGVKQRLNCKPFKYFLDVVAPDMLERYPPVDPPHFASGGVSFVVHSKYLKLKKLFLDSKRGCANALC